MTFVEKPGHSTPWMEINQLLAVDERFSLEGKTAQGCLLAPKSIDKMSDLLKKLDQLTVFYAFQEKKPRFDSFSREPVVYVSTRALTKVRLCSQSIVEVEAGCDLQSFNSALFSLNGECGLEARIGLFHRRSIGDLLRQGAEAGLVLRNCPIQERIMAIEILKPNGIAVKLGQDVQGANAGPCLQRLIWGIGDFEGVIIKIFLKIDPIPPQRLFLSWLFNDQADLWTHLEKLKQAATSWERLDCLISGHSHEKGLVMAQLSGLPEEIELFKRCHGSLLQTASMEDKRHRIHCFLIEQNLTFKPTSLEEARQRLVPTAYLWFHVLTGRCWLASVEAQGEQKEQSPPPKWAQDLLLSLTS